MNKVTGIGKPYLLVPQNVPSNYVTLSNIVPKLHSIEKKNQALKRNSLTSNKDFCVIGEGLHKPSYLIDLPCLFLVR